MQEPGHFNAFDSSPEPAPRRKGMPWWGWLIITGVVVIVLPCFGCVGWFAYVVTVAPETSVYTGNQVPQRFLDTAADVGALEPDEKIKFFYSDAISDIRDGFYFVSNKRVVIYSEDDSTQPLTVVEFDQIEEASLVRDTSFINDSTIYIDLKDGTPISFPVSSENDGDVRFFEAIEDSYDAPDN